MRLAGTFRLVALAAALAIGMLDLLPAAHTHVSDSGTIVHRHATSAAHIDHEHLADDHHGRETQWPADVRGSEHHLQAQLLPDEFLANPLFWLNSPEGGAVPLGDAPIAHFWWQRARTTLLPTHDPPLRYCSSPAPPLAS